MKKRFWALLLAVMMVVSVLPTAAFAVDAEGKVTARKMLVCDEKGNPIVDADGCYTIKLTVQGNPVTTSVQPNADVVLVVDNSGSMASSVGRECTATQFRETESYNFLILWTWHSYVCDQCGATYFSIVGNLTGDIYYTDLPDKCTGEVGTVVRMNAAKDVSKEFAQSILQNSDGSPTGNRLAVIGFAHENDQGGATDTGAIRVQKDLTDNLSAVTGEIDKMAAKGGTNYSAALQKAYDYLDERSAEYKANRPGYVIFISDGAPGRSGKSQGDSNWNGSTQITNLKAANITVYTVGIALEEGPEGPAEYLKNMASDEKTDHFINVTGEDYKDQLSSILAAWAAQIKKVPAGTNAVMVDEINTDDFEYDVSGLVHNDAVTFNQGTATITWNIGKITEAAKVIEFKVKPKEGKSGTLYTNTDVNLTYLPAGASETAIILEKDIGRPTVTIGAPPATTVTVTFNANGGAWADAVEGYTMGTDNKTASITAEKPYSLVQITEPKRDGYRFTGWYYEGVPVALVGQPINEDITLTAGWELLPPGTVNYTVCQHYMDANSTEVYAVNLVDLTADDTTTYADVIADYDDNKVYYGETYLYVASETTIPTGATVNAPLQDGAVIHLYYYLDAWHDATNPDDKDSDKGGDGIPDKYQAVIRYVSENDANGKPKGSVSFAKEVVTVKDETYFITPVANGMIKITGSKATAADGYLFKNWTSDENLTVDGASVSELKGQRISGVQGGRTYTFTAHFDEAIPGLELSKTVKSIGGVAVSGSELPMAAEGDVIVWTISVKNTGNCSLKDITVTDVLKDKDGNVLSGVSVFPVGTYGNIGNELDLPFKIGDYLAAGDTAVYEARYTVTANDAGKTLINSVSATGADSMDAPGVTVKNPALSVTKTVNKTSVTVGDKIIYTITVKNTGNVDLTNVNVVEAFGGDFSKIFDLTGATKASSFNGFMIGELKAGETKEITFSYKTTTRGTLTNSVKVTGTYEPGKTVEDRAASSDVTVKSEPITPVGPSKPQLNYEDHYAYVVGYPDGLVHPERNITRAEVATIFFRMLLDESREYFWAQENDFSDVAETDWFNNAVSTLANAQLINGYPDGSYRPNANITRAEFATIAIRFFLDEDVEIEENNLSDVKGHWAEANINLAYALELINGYPDGTFRPDQKITRAEAMAIVNRVLKRAPEKDHLLKDMIEWPDNLNTAAWYYADVQEATNSHKFHMDKEEEYEIWTELLPVRDWVALEQEWSKANSSKNPGEVVDIKITTPEAGDNGLKLD